LKKNFYFYKKHNNLKKEKYNNYTLYKFLYKILICIILTLLFSNLFLFVNSEVLNCRLTTRANPPSSYFYNYIMHSVFERRGFFCRVFKGSSAFCYGDDLYGDDLKAMEIYSAYGEKGDYSSLVKKIYPNQFEKYFCNSGPTKLEEFINRDSKTICPSDLQCYFSHQIKLCSNFLQLQELQPLCKERPIGGYNSWSG
jgi:hypothetical protein